MEQVINKDELQLHPRPLPALFMFLMGIIFLFASLASNERSTQAVAIFLMVFSALLYFIFSKTRIILNREGLEYKNIFSRKKVRYDTVLKTYVKFYHRGKSSSYYWYFETTDQRKERISLRFFSRKSLGIMATEVISHCRGAVIHDQIHDMAQGRFPWRMW